MVAINNLCGQAERHLLLDKVVPDQYIVVLKDGLALSAINNILDEVVAIKSIVTSDGGTIQL